METYVSSLEVTKNSVEQAVELFKQNKVRLVFCDLDGTLLRSGEEGYIELGQAVQKLHEQGTEVIIMTGLPPQLLARRGTHIPGITPPGVELWKSHAYFGNNNGNRVFDAQGELVHSFGFSEGEVEGIKQFLTDNADKLIFAGGAEAEKPYGYRFWMPDRSQDNMKTLSKMMKPDVMWADGEARHN